MSESQKILPQLFVIVLASAIVFSGCEDWFNNERDPSSQVYIPDSAFLNDLIEQGVDLNGDGLISYAEAEAVKKVDVGRCGNLPDEWRKPLLYSLTGIEAFVNLDTLICYSNLIRKLDVSRNTALTHLDCSFNILTTLDISKNTALTSLYCGANHLTNLDISENTSLNSLNCAGNDLTTLDISKNTALMRLDCHFNKLTTLDVSKGTALTVLNCEEDNLSSLDVSKNIALTYLSCGTNSLTSLDVSENTALTYLDCHGNSISSLDFSKNSALTYINITKISTLNRVCVWTMPFPPYNVNLEIDASPHVYFSTDCSDK